MEDFKDNYYGYKIDVYVEDENEYYYKYSIEFKENNKDFYEYNFRIEDIDFLPLSYEQHFIFI